MRKIWVRGFERRKGGKGRNANKKHGSGRAHLLFLVAATADRALNVVSTNMRQTIIGAGLPLGVPAFQSVARGVGSRWRSSHEEYKARQACKKEKGKG